MAGDWIKMRTNLDHDPRIIEIAAILGISELHAVGCLWKVWAWADQHTLDGNAIRVTDVTLDRFTAVTGFAAALRKVGWLEGRDGALTFPRFAEHNGQTAKNRAETNKRVSKHRNAKPVTDVTQKPLPEKRREEKSIPPNPQGLRGWDELQIPEKFQRSQRLMDALQRYGALQASHGRYNTIAFQDLIEKLSSYPERRVVGYLKAWTLTNKWKPTFDNCYESHQPAEETKSADKPRSYEPRIPMTKGASDE